ncbi:MAG: helix-turn-helix domain-containing protein [Heliobacteriaceae bacterium]|jgi:probable addiction module antidote protein|nr:helix-turn-helix domain-containing protein [Heliobacteriaceae bacterium]
MNKYQSNKSFEEHITEFLQQPGVIPEFLNVALEDYVKDGDFNSFYKSLEYVVKAREGVTGLAKKTKLSRTTLYDIFNNKKEPKVITLAKILDELGLKLQVA